MKKLLTSKLAIALVISLLVPSIATTSHAETIKIGVITALSGELAGFGISSMRAAELVADEYNAKGGINGKKVEIIVVDDQCKPEISPSAATKLLSQNVVAVVGALCSGATKAVLPIFTEANIVLISPASTTPDLTLDGKSPTFMRTIGHDYSQSEVGTEFIGKELKAKKVAFLDDNTEYGSNYARVTRENIKKNYPNIEIVLSESVTPNATDYSAIVRKVGRSGADVLVWGGYHADLSKIAANMHEFGYDKIRIVAADAVKDNEYIQIAGAAAETTYASAPADTSNNKLSQAATKAHIAKYNANPGTFFENAYAATQAIASAIEKSKSTKTDDIIKQLRSNKVATPVGTIVFDKNGDAIGVGMSMYKVDKGKFIPVFTQ